MKNTIATLALAVSAFGCANAPQAATPRSVALACNQLPADNVLASVLTPGATFDAKPIKEIKVIARASQPEVLVGAEVQLAAPPTVTKEYLERVLTCHAYTGVAAHSADPFHPTDGSVSQIDVQSKGGTLAIQIRGNSKAANRDILGRARNLTTPSADVTVEQVGQAASAQLF